MGRLEQTADRKVGDNSQLEGDTARQKKKHGTNEKRISKENGRK